MNKWKRLTAILTVPYYYAHLVFIKLSEQVENCGRQNSGPKYVHVLILGTCEYVTLHGKRDFADAIKLRISKWADYPGLSR